ncbi:MAG: dockerin type I domain-containing protein [Lachnospiraceae bacterium]
MTTKRKRKRVLAWICSLLVLTSYVGAMPYIENEMTVYAATQTGKVNGDLVNVRTGAGTSFDYVRNASGSKVQLNRNNEVTILGTATASDGTTWYQVSFYSGGVGYTGYVFGEYVNLTNVVDYVEDADFEKYLSAQGFPDSYKEGLRNLHAQYPKWTFVADHLNYDWNVALENESVVGRSLINSNAISSWKSMDPSAYDYKSGKWYGFDGASWVAASKELVAYCMDPRNFLDSSSVFQFEKLAYDGNVHKIEGVDSIITNTFMQGVTIPDDNGGAMSYSQAIMNAAMVTGVSPYHLASRIIQEMGVGGGSGSISGAVSGYEGLYNYFNQGAYAHDGRSAIINGLIYARKNGWDSRYKAIVGGASYIGKYYINAGQNTLYYEKFDFVGDPYTHQYMTNILAPSAESANVAKGYTEEMRKNLNLVFVIPVFQNMPETPCQKPGGSGSANNTLASLGIEGVNLTPTFSSFVYDYDVIVDKSVASINVSATALDSTAMIAGTGTVNLNEGSNEVKIAVTAENGEVKVYTINVFRGDASDAPDNTTSGGQNTSTGGGTGTVATGDVKITENYTLTSIMSVDTTNKIVAGIQPGVSAAELLKNVKTSEGEAYVLNNDGTINAGNVATGNQFLMVDKDGKEVARYNVVIYGDVNGDGAVDSLDLVYVKRHVLGIKSLEGTYAVAGDTNRQNDGISSLDLLYLKRHILDISKIQQ